MPDSDDYDALRRLLENPSTWTNAEADLMRSSLRSQRAAVEGCHLKDAVRRQAMSKVAENMETALRLWEAST